MRSRISDLTLIASGGIASGVHIAKSLALGADLAGSARLVIKALHRDGQDGVRKLIELWAMELKGVMFLVGAATVEHLKNSPLHRIE
jgi:isopentenyl-diphosphate delta-isomerase